MSEGVSDIHLNVGRCPSIRKNGLIYHTTAEPLTEDDLLYSISATIPSNFENKVFEQYDMDYSYEIKGVSRFRINIGRELGKPMMTIRMIPSKIPPKFSNPTPGLLNMPPETV